MERTRIIIGDLLLQFASSLAIAYSRNEAIRTSQLVVSVAICLCRLNCCEMGIRVARCAALRCLQYRRICASKSMLVLGPKKRKQSRSPMTVLISHD